MDAKNAVENSTNNTPSFHLSHQAGWPNDIVLAAWDFRSFLETLIVNCLEWSTAPVVRKLVGDKVNIAALGVTCFSEQGQVAAMGIGYAFFWGGHQIADRSQITL